MECLYAAIIMVLSILSFGLGIFVGNVIRYYEGLIDLNNRNLEKEKQKTKLLEDMLTSSVNKDYDRHNVTIVNKDVIWDEED